jgi:Tol biopolymer transport system component
MNLTRKVLLISMMLGAWCTQSQAQSVASDAGNIVYTDVHGKTTQLTNSGVDAFPSLSPDGRMVVFVRTVKGEPVSTGSSEGLPTELWVTDIRTLKAEMLVASKQAEDMKEVLAGFTYPQFSVDGKRIFFLSAAWATSDAVHCVDIASKRQRFVTDGNSLEVIRSGALKGKLRINQHRYRKGIGGAYDHDYIFSEDGIEVKKKTR